MLGKQWMNRYESIGRRGPAVKRSHSRQRQLDGITAWYFDYVMELLPLMLQGGLLLLSCALSHYLWQINIIIASVVLTATSFGVMMNRAREVTCALAVQSKRETQSPGSTPHKSLERIWSERKLVHGRPTQDWAMCCGASSWSRAGSGIGC